MGIFQCFADETQDKTAIAVHLPMSETDGRELINDIVVIASTHVIGLNTRPFSKGHPDWSQRALIHLHCDVTSGPQQSKHVDVTNLSRATWRVYGRKFDIKTQGKRDEKYANWKRKVWIFKAGKILYSW